MRAPEPTFKSALVAYQQQALKDAAGPERDLIAAVIDRWLEHRDREIETIWHKIVEASDANGKERPVAEGFIDWFLMTCLVCERLSDTIAEAPAVYSALRVQAERDWKQERVSKAANTRIIVKAHARKMDDVLGRKKKEAPRVRFMRMVREMFIENCGKPLNDVVAVLTEVAFGQPVTTDAVKKGNIRPRK